MLPLKPNKPGGSFLLAAEVVVMEVLDHHLSPNRLGEESLIYDNNCMIGPIETQKFGISQCVTNRTVCLNVVPHVPFVTCQG